MHQVKELKCLLQHRICTITCTYSAKCKVQIHNNHYKFCWSQLLEKLLADRQDNLSSLQVMGKDISQRAGRQEAAHVEAQLDDLSVRFDTLSGKWFSVNDIKPCKFVFHDKSKQLAFFFRIL